MSTSTQSYITFLILFFLQFIKGSYSTTFNIVNKCSYTVWPGILTGAGTPPLSTTGFTLAPGESNTIAIPAAWSGRIWGRTLCSQDTATGKFSCITGDCDSSTEECAGGGAAPPATLAEFTLNGAGGLDFYDVSFVDGYNLPIKVEPQGGTGAGNCTATGCVVDLNAGCPTELRVVNSGNGEESVACKSACEAFGDPQYCCSGAYATPETCKPSSYSQFFKSACPLAYSYAYDDGTSTFTCASADYIVTFCPEPATFTFMNKCDYTVWPGILGKPDLGTTGFELTEGTSRSFQAPAGWSGRFWARTNCKFDDSGRGTCATADCGSGDINCNGAGASPPATLAEFTLGAGSMDYYDVSLVDGYNLPIMVAASGGSGSCATTGCGVDLNQQCPSELRVEGGDACKSACEAFGKAEYCCNGEFSNPSTCKPSVYSQMFKSACPKSYSYAYDDATSTFTCTGADYTITFCPSSPSLKSATDSSPKGTDSASGSESQSELASTSWLADMATATGDSSRTQHSGFSKASFFVAYLS
ncbi:PREDICTED: uncharacterized protein LOC109331061 isoform X2 [Lupinus angustifolius]|uniref:uncharacterized protein LOC109331061 isoform X2 n=1 Tax=Lupinus angustifolius TaxID=3871 RepID=UPI00092E9B73|nr:PREDICTED: uncharacterized protein LOC109331061 isoform X2 [Lupinus angustifolius]